MHVLIIDDHCLLRDSLSLLLEKQYGHDITIQHATSANEALDHAQQQPTLIMLDIGLPDTRGDGIIKQLHSIAPSAHIIMLSAFDSPSMIQHCINEGARGFIPKRASSQTVVTAIRHVLQGNIYHPSPTTNPSHTQEPQVLLSERQKEVLQQVRLGHSNQQIAESLHISMPTVKTHVRNIMIVPSLSVVGSFTAASKTDVARTLTV